jgi:hypothetical protein
MLDHRRELSGSPPGPPGRGKKKPPGFERRPGGEFSGNSTHGNSLSAIYLLLSLPRPKFKNIFRQFTLEES